MTGLKLPKQNTYWLHQNKVYKILQVGTSMDIILMEDFTTGKTIETKFSTFKYGFERVVKVHELAILVNRSTRSIYRYEVRGQIKYPKRFLDKFGNMVRFYTRQDIEEVRDLIASIPQGRPRSDGRIMNNHFMDAGNFRQLIREFFQ